MTPSSADRELDDFSFLRQGPFYRLALNSVMCRKAAWLIRLGVILGLVAWVPLFVLCASQNVLVSGAAIPFSASFGTHARFLLAVPLFFVAEAWFDVRARQVIRELVQSKTVPTADLPAFVATLRRASAVSGSWLVELGLAVMAITFLVIGVRSDLPPDLSTWRHVAGTSAALTWAGWWYTVVAMPLFQFLSWRWCWRLLIWWWLLWKMSVLHLQLTPRIPISQADWEDSASPTSTCAL
jgi:hypothetical protein